MGIDIDVPGPSKVPKMMAQYTETESIAGRASIIFGCFGGLGIRGKEPTTCSTTSLGRWWE